MKFEWDELKNDVNINKHGIDFADVIDVFDGPMIVNVDDRYEYSETRSIGLGWMKSLVAVIVFFVEIDNDTTRIISARKANSYERKEFEKEVKNRLGQAFKDVR